MCKVRSYGPAALATLVALIAAATVSFASEAPAGIVMAVSGRTDPPLSAMAEILTDTPIRLGSGSKLRFLDYARCQLVTIAGGTLTLSRTGYKTDGRIMSEREAPCPYIYSIEEPTRITRGLVMRGGSENPHWAVDSEFLLTGIGAGEVRAAAIYAEDQPDTPVVTLDLKGGQAVEPPGALPPSPNARYLLRLSFGNRAKPIEISFVGVVPNGTNSLVVLRID